VRFASLVAFLQSSGRFEPYAHRAVTRLVIQNAIGDLDVEVESRYRLKDAFRDRCRMWGWKTREDHLGARSTRPGGER
jgi:hypothetical protein